jgi:hypothetical protein
MPTPYNFVDNSSFGAAGSYGNRNNLVKMKLPEITLVHVRNALLFVLGVVVTVMITKTSDKIVPNDPVVVKQYSDTIRIIHDYKLPEKLDNDSERLALQSKIKNLELLNDYDKQISEKLASIEEKSGSTPNLIISQNIDFSGTGFMSASSSPYFTAECPNINAGKYLDLQLFFLNPSIAKDIACLRVNMYKYDNVTSSQASSYVLEDFYEVKPNQNLIRISNDFSPGKYEVMFGFVFKKDMNNKYPRFYFKRCVLVKNRS